MGMVFNYNIKNQNRLHLFPKDITTETKKKRYLTLLLERYNKQKFLTEV